MSIWQNYPPEYRQTEAAEICAAVDAGESAAVIGLSGSGKSNLLGFLANCITRPPRFIWVDCNRLLEKSPAALFRLIRQSMGDSTPVSEEDHALETAVASRLQQHPILALLLDRFDALGAAPNDAVTNSLRALRDRFKYQLCYVIATRRPLDARSELAELFFAHTCWLGPLSAADAHWSAASYAARRGVTWDESVIQRLVALSGGYPSFLRAACEAHAAGCPLESAALQAHPAVRRRLDEFWSDAPSPADLQRSQLAEHPWLQQTTPPLQNTSQLTALEMRLLQYFQMHPNQICEKDALIQSVWPEDRIYTEGIRDDSLAQLIRRLRQKIEPDPARPQYIHTLPGRGYRFTPPE